MVAFTFADNKGKKNIYGLWKSSYIALAFTPSLIGGIAVTHRRESTY
jgi:hypothetical protein